MILYDLLVQGSKRIQIKSQLYVKKEKLLIPSYS